VEVFREIKWLDLVDKLLKQVTESLDFLFSRIVLIQRLLLYLLYKLKNKQDEKIILRSSV
jgi:hypothetical protein